MAALSVNAAKNRATTTLWELNMSEGQITSHGVLNPSIVRTIREAFDEAIVEIERKRGNIPLPDHLRAEVAKRLVDLARHGECDSQKLRRAALALLPV